MSRPIDEKIVAMKMDNSDFKKKALETTSLFGKLRSSLNKIPGVNLSKISNGLSGIERAADRVTLGGLSRSVEAISSRFTTLGVVATTALVNISNRAVDAGINVVKSLGMDQVISGFHEYETKIGSIATVLSNTEWNNTSLQDVNSTLADLNNYADKTIYNFGQMTQNIGRFTAAGVTLEDSATAIKGLGNLAAISGSNTEQLNTAMYQMSQALAAGKLNLMDWNSLVNAGMAGKKTQDALIQTAKDMGINVDMSNGFRDSIHSGWLTSKVFLATLKKFGKDKSMTDAATKVRTLTQLIDTVKEGIGSGWAKSWEIIVGDFDHATKLWTGLSNSIGGFFQRQAKARNDLLEAVFRGGGLTKVFEGMKNITEPLVQIFGAIGDGFRKAFPVKSAAQIRDMIDAFAKFTSNLKLSKKTVENIKTIFAGFFSVFAIGWKIVKGAISIVLALIPSFSGLGSKILELIARVAKIPIAFNNASDSSDAFGAAINVLKKVASGISSVLEYIVDGLIAFADAIGAAYNIISKGDFSNGPWSKDSVIAKKLSTIRNAVIDTVDAIKGAWSILTTGKYDGGPWSKDSDAVSWLTKMRKALKGFGSALSDLQFSMEPVSKAFSSFFDSLKRGFRWVADKFSQLGEIIRNSMPNGNQLLAGGFIAGLVAIVIFAFKKIKGLFSLLESWTKIGDSINEFLDSVSGAFKSFQQAVKARALLTIAIAVGVLAAAFLVMSQLDGKQIATGLYAIIGSLTGVVGAMAIMTKYDITGAGMKAALQIVALSIAFGILAGALKKISDLDWEEISKGLVGLAGVIGVFAGAITLMTRYGGTKLQASTLEFIAIAGSVLMLVKALKQIADMNWEDIGKGMAGLATALAIFTGAILLLSRFGKGKMAASSLEFVAIAGSILIMVAAIKKIADINPSDLETGLKTISLILLAIAAFTIVTGKVNLLSAGIGITLLAVALNLIVIPILALGSMDLGTLAKGLGAMAIALRAIGLASMLMTGMVAAGLGLILVAAGLNLLLIPIAALGNMSLTTLSVGILAVAASIIIIGGAAALLGTVAPALLLGAAGIAVLGVAMLAAGFGMSLFSTGLVTLATMSATAVATIVAVIGTLIIGLTSLIPTAVNFVVDLVMQIAGAITTNAPVLTIEIANMLIKMLNAIANKEEEFINAGTKIITNFLDGIANNIPKIVQSANNLIISFVNSLATSIEQNGPKFINAIMRLMAEVMILFVRANTQVISALYGWIPGVKEATEKIGNSAEESIRKAFNAQKVGTDKGKDFSNSLSAQSGGARKSGSTVSNSAKEAMKAPDFGIVGKEHGTEFASGLSSKDSLLNSTGKTLADHAKNGADAPNFSPVGSEHGTELASGLSSKNSLLSSTGTSLANHGKSGADSPNFSPVGSGHGYDFAKGLSSKNSSLYGTGKSLANHGRSGAESISLSSAGVNFGKGFAGGMNSHTVFSSIWSAGVSIARRAKEAVSGWLDMHSPSRVMIKDGEFFGEGFAIGIVNKAKRVGEKAKELAITAKDSLNHFLDGFQLPVDDNELHFKAVVDYDALDVKKFGDLKPLYVKPDTSVTNGLITATKADLRQNGYNIPNNNSVDKSTTQNNQYDIHVTANGTMSKSAIRKLAESIQEEIKDINDRGKISRGEEVVF